jgi:hypothetical protein
MHFLPIMHKLKTVILLLVVFVAVERFCHKQTRGFAMQKILSHLSDDEEAFPVSDEDYAHIDALLVEPFTFLHSGGQCYAFISQDGTTVLKVFKQHHLRWWRILHTLPLPGFCEPLRARQMQKMKHYSPLFLESCSIAYRDFKDQSGLIYLHLNKTRHFNRKATLIDPLGIAHTLDLDNTQFALQKKAQLCFPKFRQLLQEGNLGDAKACIDSLFALIREKERKGIKDRDPHIRKNIGFIGNQAVEIDIGSFTKAAPGSIHSEWTKITRRLHTYLTKHNAELSLYLNSLQERSHGQTHHSQCD